MSGPAARPFDISPSRWGFEHPAGANTTSGRDCVIFLTWLPPRRRGEKEGGSDKRVRGRQGKKTEKTRKYEWSKKKGRAGAKHEERERR